jgi:hypothetical protein
LVEDRIVGSENRYYTITLNKTGLAVVVDFVDTFGRASFSLYSGCGSLSGASLGGVSLLWTPTAMPNVMNLGNLPPGSYVLVASNIAPGTRYRLSLQ